MQFLNLNNKYRNIYTRLKKSKLIEDSFWSLFGNVIGRGLALLAGIFIARFLGKNLYGEYEIIRSTILTIGVFSTFGLGYTATKYIAEFKIKNLNKIPFFIKLINSVTVLFSGLMAVFLFIFSAYISNEWLEAPQFSTTLKMLSVLIVFNAINTTQIGVLAGLGKFKLIAKINILVGFSIFFLSSFLTYLYGLNGALFSLLITQTLNCFLNYIYVKKEISNISAEVVRSKGLLRDVLAFSSPIALQEAVYSTVSWSASIFLIKFSTYGELGMYSAAMQWNAIILFIPSILRNVILSHLSAASADYQKHTDTLNKTLIINLIVTLFSCVIVFLASSFIAKVYGEGFEGLAELISIAVFTTVFQSISNVYSQAYMSLGKNWLMFYMKTVMGLLQLMFFYIIINYYSISGAKALIYSGLLFGFLYSLIFHGVFKKIKIIKT